MKKSFTCLSPRYGDLFVRNVTEFKSRAEKDRKYSLFYPSFGAPKGKEVDFLIYGQAVKGWKPQFNTSEALNKEQLLKDAIEYSNDYYAEEKHSPLDWVNVYWSKSDYKYYVKTPTAKEYYPELAYSTSRSFFWNVIYKLICKKVSLSVNGNEWATKLVWSNLYKIAPAEEVNPNDNECSWQEKISIELVKMEIDEINPKFCIVLTNDTWWEPFREHIKTKKVDLKERKNGIIESVEKYKNTTIIVTKRPFIGSSEKHVTEIYKLIK